MRAFVFIVLFAVVWRTVVCGPVSAMAAPQLTISAEERACLDDLKLLYPADGNCYQLLSQGPCESNEWLVLDSRSPGLRPVCQVVPCAEREVLWPRDGRCYQRFRDRETLCPHSGNLLISNPFGLGECACMRTPPHARDVNAKPTVAGACHAIYHQGPCKAGEMFMPKRNGTADQGICQHDPCYRFNSKLDGRMPMVVWDDGDRRCHQLGSTDACPGESSFGIHPQTLRPGCISRTNYLLPSTPCSGGKCSPTNTASYSEGYIKELLNAHNRIHKAHKRSG